MAEIDKHYHKLGERILNEGFDYNDPNRIGTKRRQVNRGTFEYDMDKGFPILTTKKVYWKGVVGETLWILKGLDNIKYLVDNNINIWNDDAYNHYLRKMKETNLSEPVMSLETYIMSIKKSTKTELELFREPNGFVLGELGPIYGPQLRRFNGHFDQLENLINTLKNVPMATKKRVNLHNPSDERFQALSVCHSGFNIMTTPYADNYEASMEFRIDSSDYFLGMPFNIASYGLILEIICDLVEMIPNKLIVDAKDVHVYHPHIDSLKKQLTMSTDEVAAPRLEKNQDYWVLVEQFRKGNIGLNTVIDNLYIEMFTLKDYNPLITLKEKMIPYTN